MRILQLGKFFPPDEGGVETATLQISRGMVRRGAVCDVLCFARTGPYADADLPFAVTRAKTLGVVASTPLSLDYVRRLAVLAPDYDILHVHMPNPMAALALFLVRPKAAVSLHWHSDVIRQKRLLALYRPLEKWCVRRAGLAVAPTATHLDASDLAGFFAGKSLAVPFCVDESFPSPEKADLALTAAIRARFPGKRIVFSLGRLIYYKGFETLIEAAARLPGDYAVIIGGTGPLKDALAARIAALGLEGRAILAGRVPEAELSSWYAACDLFCLPSTHRSEMFGIVMLEAMAFGKPIVSTAIPRSGVTWVNEDGVTGLTVPPGDPAALAAAIVKAGSDPALYARFSGNCRLAVRERFSEGPVMDKLYAGFERLSGAGGTPLRRSGGAV